VVVGFFMMAHFVNDDGTIRNVWIRLTTDEKRHYRNAYLLALLFFWRTPSCFLGSELELIVCGHKPERYVELEDWHNLSNTTSIKNLKNNS